MPWLHANQDATLRTYGGRRILDEIDEYLPQLAGIGSQGHGHMKPSLQRDAAFHQLRLL